MTELSKLKEELIKLKEGLRQMRKKARVSCRCESCVVLSVECQCRWHPPL